MSYSEIGVRTFINCCGTRTIHSGTLMLPCVREAMVEASGAFVNMDELMEGVGRRVAKLTGAEHAIVTSGGAASLCVAAAAAVTGGDPERIQRLPQLDGQKDRVVMLGSGRFTYDQAIRAVGATIVEVHSLSEMERALEDERVAMVALLGTDRAKVMSVAVVAGMAKQKGVPVLVDAASERLVNPNPYLAAGASMVAYSGGKYLRGPQCTGLLIGEEKWVRAGWTNAAPHHTFARMMKVGKEEIMGVLAAVEYWATDRDDEAEYKEMERALGEIADCVETTDGVTTEVLHDRTSSPRMEIRWPTEWIHGLDVREELMAGEPRIMLDDRGATDGSLLVLPFSIQSGEAKVVGEAVRACLERKRKLSNDAGLVSVHESIDVGGEWEVEVAFHAGTASHLFRLEQAGNALVGIHRIACLEHEAAGSVEGNRMVVTAEHPYEGTRLIYAFRGTVEGDVASGEAEVGTEGQSAPGPLNRREYGTYRWTGRRVRGGTAG